MLRRNPEPTAEAIKAAAEEALRFFKKGTRTSGEDYWYTDSEPEWVRDLRYDAHGDMMPDDWKHEFIVESLNHVMDLDDPDDGPELEADPYHSELLSWLSSNLIRMSYVDDGVSDAGWPSDGGIMAAISYGQLREKEEVFFSVLNSLKEHVAEAGK